jgi:thiamine biosynthesis lipoprotein
MNRISRQTWISSVFVLAALAFLVYRSRTFGPPSAPVERVWPVMGTFASVTLRGDHAGLLDPVSDETAAILERINSQLSVYSPDSEISSINSATGAVAISKNTRQMLELTRYYTTGTGGAFDATVMPLVRLWGFSGGQTPEQLPSAEMIESARRLTGIDKLEIGETTARMTVPGTTLDLGGIAKGFAVDRTYEAIIAQYTVNAIFNLGGNIRVHGKATPERTWRIGVQDPFQHGSTLGVLELASGMAVATSGNYERFVMINGKRYAHIIDPRTGYPVEGMAGVTVLSESATEADALSTALFVTGIDGAAAILSRFPGSEAILVPDRHPIEIYVSKGMPSPFTPHPEYRSAVRLLPSAL